MPCDFCFCCGVVAHPIVACHIRRVRSNAFYFLQEESDDPGRDGAKADNGGGGTTGERLGGRCWGGGVAAGRIARPAGELEAGARQAGGVGGVDGDGAVADEGADAHGVGGVEVEVGGLEGRGGDFAVLAAQVTHLAGLGLGVVARGYLAADVGVQMGEGAGAGAGGGDRLVVDVVHCVYLSELGPWGMENKGVRAGGTHTEWAERCARETVQIDVEHQAGAIGVRGGCDVPSDRGGFGVGTEARESASTSGRKKSPG